MPASQQSIAELPSGIQRNGRRSAATNVFRSLWDDRLGAAGVAILLIVLIISIAPGAFAPYSPHTIDLDNAFSPPSYLQGGVAGHPLGTDHLGRDLFSRILYSARVSLLVAIAAVAVSAVFGILMGLLAGYVGSWLDNLIMGVTEMQAALPVILLALAIVAVLGPGVLNLVLVLSLTGWVIYARTVRAMTLSLREKEFTNAARSIGCSSPRIMLRHMLPQTIGPLIVVATLEVARMMILESALSFLGLGVQPPDLSWGLLLGEGSQYLLTAPWLATFPGIAIAATVFAVNSMGDWLRGILDPSMKQR